MVVLSREERKEAKKTKRANWKAYKKAKRLDRKTRRREDRMRRKAEYADAPALRRFCYVNAKRFRTIIKVLLILAVVAIVAMLFVGPVTSTYQNAMYEKQTGKVRESDVPQDEIYALSPLDEEGAKRIDAIPSNDVTDTWTFCVYVVGANLEDKNENDLSDYVKQITKPIKENNVEAKKEAGNERLERYANELKANGLDVPYYLYNINKPLASSSQVVTEDVVKAEKKGAASTDIEEMCYNDLPDNITVVVQTGGATRWSNTLINPNRTQRFEIKNGFIKEVDNMHIQDSCDPATLTDFIKYCDNNYSADHMALILWDHGSGVAGFGYDDIFESSMTCKDIEQALSKAVKKNVKDPYFDLIGFDACLMASTDMASLLDGYGTYLAASEETEPADGWDYISWMQALGEDTSMSAAKIARTIADTYTDYFIKQNMNDFLSSLVGNLAVTFSVVDIHEAAQLDAAYEAMNEKFLNLIADDPVVLTDMSRAAARAIRYSGSSDSYFNMIDLGDYVDYLSEEYPDECQEVREQLKKAVLYTRSNHYLAGSQGLAVYFPTNMSNSDSLYLLTNYVYEISDKPCTNALYYYKAAGCLNEEMKEMVADVTGKELKLLDTEKFYNYQKIVPKISEDQTIVIEAGEELLDHVQNVYVELVNYDDEMEVITYYGTDDCCGFDENGNIIAEVDGHWFALDDVYLDAEYCFGADTLITYKTKVLHNGKPSYMNFTYNTDTGEVTIDSVAKIPDPSKLEYDTILRVKNELLPGDKIVPIITVQDASGQNSEEKEGTSIKYSANSKIELADLPDGRYLQSVVITDMRGDEYYSPVVEATFKNGKTTNLELNPLFVGMVE